MTPPDPSKLRLEGVMDGPTLPRFVNDLVAA